MKELDTLPAGDARGAELRSRIAASSASNAADLERELAAFPNSGLVLGRLCNLYRKSDPVKALDRCKRASEAEPNNVDHTVGFGAALVQAKQYEQAGASAPD